MRLGGLFVAAGMAAGCFAAGIVTLEPDEAYRFQLTTLVNPASGSIGLILKTRIDGGPVLRLLLDSGAEHLVLSRGALRKSDSKNGTEVDLVGAGFANKAARMINAEQVEIGALTLRACPMVVVEGRLAPGIDGVIPLSLFAGYLVRLDVARGVLELTSYPESHPPVPEFVRAANHANLLFLEGRVSEAQEGLMLLDTGSAYNVIHCVGKPDAHVLPERLTLRAGGGNLQFDRAVAMDLTEIGRRNGIQVSGIIGYPALARSVVTVNYRDSLVRIQATKDSLRSR